MIRMIIKNGDLQFDIDSDLYVQFGVHILQKNDGKSSVNQINLKPKTEHNFNILLNQNNSMWKIM